MAEATVEVEARWRRRAIEPEGDPCECCGEVAWLNPTGLWAEMKLADGTHWVATTKEPLVVLCQGCAEEWVVDVAD